MNNKIYFLNAQRKVRLPEGIKEKIMSAFNTVLLNEGIIKDSEISVTFVSNKRIREINKEFRNIDRSTDVLSFPLGENSEYDINPETDRLMLGDVVISLEHAVQQADEYGHKIEREIVYLSVHSMLHLLGYDHVDDQKEAKIMRKKEESVMKIIGLERK